MFKISKLDFIEAKDFTIYDVSKKDAEFFFRENATDIGRLIKIAKNARGQAIAPTSGYALGSAGLANTGQVYSGHNIEGELLRMRTRFCAERNVMDAIQAQEEDKLLAKELWLNMIVICGDNREKKEWDKNGQSQQVMRPPFPCGYCREDLEDFCKDRNMYNLPITTVNPAGQVTGFTYLGSLVAKPRAGV
jgi:cytidine deaminase